MCGTSPTNQDRNCTSEFGLRKKYGLSESRPIIYAAINVDDDSIQFSNSYMNVLKAL